MGKALILIVAASLMGAGFVIFTGVQQSTYRASVQLSEHEARVLARQIVLSGVSEARAGVLTNPGAVTEVMQFSGSTMGGTYSTTITPVGEGEDIQFVIRVESRMPLGPDRGFVSHTIELTYALANDSEVDLNDDGVPQFFTYALLMNGPLNVNGNMRVLGGPSLNADIHTNSSISLEGGNSVAGFGTYVTTAASKPARRLMTTFSPAVNPDDLPTVQQKAPINILRFNAADYADLATRVTEGNLTLSGNNVLGTRDNPEIWYVTGELSVAAGTRLDGYAIFMVEGDIVLGGNFTTTGAVGNESSLGFYTSSSVRMSGSVEVYGQFLARENLTFSGTSTLHGNVTVGGTVVWGGTPTIQYREASPALTTPLWPEPIAGFAEWRPVNYREWAGRTDAEPAGIPAD